MAHRTQLAPFLGAGASASVLPTGSELVEHLIAGGSIEYPEAADRDLMRVAQYYQVMSRDHFGDVRAEIADMLKAKRGDLFDSPPHKALAALPVPLYITTNYDDLLEHELKRAMKLPISLYPLWRPGLEHATEQALGKDEVEDITPTAERPIVYHLHGHWDVPESMVVTEDDYINFLSVIHNPDLLPAVCRKALVSAHLLFVGYSLRDWNIRILLNRRLHNARSLAIIRHPNDSHLAEFLERDLDRRGVQILWGTAQEFTNEFMARWEASRL
jgi:hypothetical protein